MAYGFSPADLLANIDAQTMFILIAFLAFFAVIFLALKGFRAFRENKGASAVISIVLSLGMTWYLNTNFSIEGVFGGLGLGNIDLFPYFVVFFLVLFFFFLFKFKNRTLLALGALFIILPFTGLLYESGLFFITGGLSLVIGFIWGHFIKKKEKELNNLNPSNLKITVYNKYNSPSGKINYSAEKARQYEKEMRRREEAELNKRKEMQNIEQKRAKIVARLDEISRQTGKIKNRMEYLKSQIYEVDVITRGKMEDELKKLSKEGRKLEDEYHSLEKDYRKFG